MSFLIWCSNSYYLNFQGVDSSGLYGPPPGMAPPQGSERPPPSQDENSQDETAKPDNLVTAGSTWKQIFVLLIRKYLHYFSKKNIICFIISHVKYFFVY